MCVMSASPTHRFVHVFRFPPPSEVQEMTLFACRLSGESEPWSLRLTGSPPPPVSPCSGEEHSEGLGKRVHDAGGVGQHVLHVAAAQDSFQRVRDGLCEEAGRFLWTYKLEKNKCQELHGLVASAALRFFFKTVGSELTAIWIWWRLPVPEA